MTAQVFMAVPRYGAQPYTGDQLRFRNPGTNNPTYRLVFTPADQTIFNEYIHNHGIGGPVRPQPLTLLTMANDLGYTKDTKQNVRELLRRVAGKIELARRPPKSTENEYPFNGSREALVNAAMTLWEQKEETIKMQHEADKKGKIKMEDTPVAGQSTAKTPGPTRKPPTTTQPRKTNAQAVSKQQPKPTAPRPRPRAPPTHAKKTPTAAPAPPPPAPSTAPTAELIAVQEQELTQLASKYNDIETRMVELQKQIDDLKI